MEKIYVQNNDDKIHEILNTFGYKVMAYETVEPTTTASIIINRETREVLSDNHTVVLTYKEYELLIYLMKNTFRVVTREELMKQIWGNDYDLKSRTLDIHIRTLRKKLGLPGVKSIITIRNVGYRYVNE